MFLLPGITYHIYVFIFSKNTTNVVDKRTNLPNYFNVNWNFKHFQELHKLKFPYKDFVVWRFLDFKGETINISDGIRYSYLPKNLKSKEKSVHFFGGSTTFGSGVNDENTYPSIFAKKTGLKTFNYGVSAYSSRQSLIAMNNRFIQKKEITYGKNLIVFYDGVNDVVHRCRNDTFGLSTQRETQIQELFWNKKYHFERTFSQLFDFTNAIVKNIKIKTLNLNNKVDDLYICDNSRDRAEEIVSTLINIWNSAYQVAKYNNHEFIAVLRQLHLLEIPKPVIWI